MYHKLVVTGIQTYHDAFYFTPEKEYTLLCALFATWLRERDPSLGFVHVEFRRGLFYSWGWAYEANTADLTQAFTIMPPVPLDSVVLSCGLVMTFDIFNTLFVYSAVRWEAPDDSPYVMEIDPVGP